MVAEVEAHSLKYEIEKNERRPRGKALRSLSPDEIKQTELSILLAFDELCKAHSLTYLLAYGTALGAARHQGFIPWDDDIDVTMPRDDFERLWDLYERGSLATELKLTTCRDKSSTYSFFKLTDPRTLVVESYLRDEYTSGLWIDIFPIERTLPEDPVEKTWRSCSRRLFLKAQRVANPNVGTSQKAIAIKRVIAPLVQPIDPYAMAESIEQRARALNRPISECPDDTTVWSCMDDLSVDKCRYPNEMLFPAGRASFEGHELPVPRDLDGYLTHCYGNWHELPPESERRSHFPEAYALDD